MAHYTTADQIDLPVVARRYGLTSPSVTPLSGGAANSSFRLTADQGAYVLTSLDDHDQDSAGAVARHTRALRRLGLPTVDVVPAEDGSLVVEVDGRLFLLKEWVAGCVRQPLPPGLLGEAGAFLARLHDLPVSAEGVEDVPVGARRLTAEHLAAVSGFADREFADWLTARLERIRRAGEGNPREPCLVHGDLFDDNIVVREDGGLTVLDWETVSVDDPLLDLGMAAVGLARDEAGLLAADRLEALLAGYAKTRPLSAADRALLPLEVEHAALVIAFHRYHRHHVRFPDPAWADHHRAMVAFTESAAGAAGAVRAAG